jgi:hypothetical protein
MIWGLRPQTPYTLTRGGPGAPLRSRGSLERLAHASRDWTIAITRATTSAIGMPVVSM